MQTQHYRTTDNFPYALLKGRKGILGKVFSDPETYRLQIVYTRIDRDARQRPVFTDFHYRSKPGAYFYPASTVKLPGAILALEKLRELDIPGLDLFTPMFTAPLAGVNTGVTADHSAASGLPSIGHYIKKIFLVSDNDAFNRLYEFIGQEAFNRRLWEAGYTSSEIRHRVGLPLHEEANRHTNAVRFMDGKRLLYQQAAQYSRLSFSSRLDLVGQAHYNHLGVLEQRPMDFSYRNRLPLVSLHEILRSIIFPEAVTKAQRFRLNESDYNFLYRCMSQYPPASKDPVYDHIQYKQAYVKFLMYGGQKTARIPSHIRIFNKPGWAYGFLTDAAYIVDFSNGIEFLLSASIYVNKDGILGDDQYEFEETGKPFLKALGEMIYQHELERRKTIQPDLGRFKTE
ncbi:serine hydrolase [Chitinophaga vietnamensis]|uniref:serine hydrolase n=1 Tax=Chitinophaga vietnamensis TaxID=2593957 RepID=UPI001178826B|nr:serine hydrolase [Chitinophaga vietnamensis]